MCVGIPMQALVTGDGWADCRGDGEGRRVDTRLIGPVAPGDWLLVFLDSAREVLDEVRAGQIQQALQALRAVSLGESVDHLFADLIDREPTLPEFLRNPVERGQT